MAQDTGQSRTEAPTPRRRQEARKKGQIALSQDMSTAALLLGTVLTLWLAGHHVSAGVAESLHAAISAPVTADWSISETSVLARWIAGRMLQTVGWLAAAFVSFSVAAALLQGGATFTTQPLKMDWERMSFAKNMPRLASWNGAAKGLLAAAKAAAIMSCFWFFFLQEADIITVSGRGTLRGALHTGWTSALRVSAFAAASLLGLALLDLLLQRFRHEQQLRMTREELKQESKEDEGDPHQRAHVRKLQRDAARERGLSEVPKAAVVITNPTHFAVALTYERELSSAPQVVAKGSGAFAKRIIRVAHRHGVPVIERKPLARLLFRVVDVGQEIPVELYRAVAEILAQVYRYSRGAGAVTG